MRIYIMVIFQIFGERFYKLVETGFTMISMFV